MIRGLALIGLLGSIALVVVAGAGKADWGVPGSPAYLAYELMNRLAGGAILLMAAAPLALRRALAAQSISAGQTVLALACVATVGMAIGSVAEFVVFSTAPYPGPGSEGRLLSWLAFLASALVMIVATVLAGVALLRRPEVPRLVSIGVVVAGPVGVVAAYADGTVFVAIPLVGVACAVAALVLSTRRYSEKRSSFQGSASLL